MVGKKSEQLGACGTCGETVSKNARTCPHCGENKPFSMPPQKASETWKIWTGVILFFMAVSLMIGNPGPQPAQVAPSLQSMCIDAIRASVTNPSTLDIHMVTGYGSDTLADGTKRVTQTFSAQNGFGAERTYDAYCLLSPAGKFDMRFAEQGR